MSHFVLNYNSKELNTVFLDTVENVLTYEQDFAQSFGRGVSDKDFLMC